MQTKSTRIHRIKETGCLLKWASGFSLSGINPCSRNLLHGDGVVYDDVVVYGDGGVYGSSMKIAFLQLDFQFRILLPLSAY
ncbi:hypothetical protein [Bacillus sp. B-jedd]|uniref:hypothetical protein n=1 Tax=Bacillus sp. B-jedd TaxID=1476857 RepID=UPI0006625D59|nr:hypothetical protein [Bacillus sp. B-jedd]